MQVDQEFFPYESSDEARIAAELRNLREKRDKEGDEAWAGALAIIIMDEIYVQILRNKAATEYSKKILKAISPHLDELHDHVSLSNKFVTYIIEQLSFLGLIDLKYTELMKRRTQKQNHRRKRE